MYASPNNALYWRRLKMTKKILSVITSVAVLGSMACATAVSTSAFKGSFSFEIPENWKNANKTFYAHIWDGLPDGDGLYGWQTKDEKMKVSDDGKTATYDIPKDGNWNLIIISGDSGIQTYDTVFNENCIGDTCYVLDKKFENPVDSKKEAYGLAWRNNEDCGPHKVVSSLGNVIGNAFLPGENDQILYDNFCKKYDVNNEADGETLFNWNDDGAIETGKTWEQVKADVAKELGIDPNSSESSSDESSESESSSSSSSSSNSSSSSSSSSSSTSSSSSQTTGATTTGDATPIAALVATLTAALGVAFFARKKA